jgi:two-component sensor histidine kinase
MIQRFFILLAVLGYTLYAADLVIVDEKGKYSDFDLHYLHEASKKLTIEEVAGLPFNAKTNSKFALGYVVGDSWLKLTVTNKSKHRDFLLCLCEHCYKDVNLYIHDQKVHRTIMHLQPKSANPTFKVELKPNQTKTLYLQMNGQNERYGELHFYTKEYYYSDVEFRPESLYLFLKGMICMIMIFSLFLYLKLKEPIYLYYSAFNFFNLLFIFRSSDMIFQVGMQQYADMLYISAPLLIAFLLLFSKEILEVRYYQPKLEIYFQAISILFIAFAALFLFMHEPLDRFFNILSYLTMLFLIVSAATIYLQGNQKSKYYIFAIVIYFVLMLCFMLMKCGYLPYNYFTRYGFLVGIMIENIVFALMLANTYNEMKDQTIKIQKELLQMKSKRELHLEEEVKSRTDQITRANRELIHLLKEREWLLREIYHRVKNNFQLVISMLWFESKQTQSNQESYLKLINRIKSMSSIHEYLYNAQQLSEINTQEYLNTIVNNLVHSYEKEPLKVTSTIDKIDLEFEKAMALGIIVNEVLNNAIKHHPKDETCYIWLDFKKTEQGRVLMIKDNGVGFDSSEESEEGLGLKLIEEFAKKFHNAHYAFSFENGTMFKLLF